MGVCDWVMLVDYGAVQNSLTANDYLVYHDTVLNNPYIHDVPYKKQALAIMDHRRRKLIGGNSYSGKSYLGYILAAQFLEFPEYRCLILRKNHDDVIATGGIVDYLKHKACNMFNEYDMPEEICCVHNETKKLIQAPSGAQIFYNYSQRDDDKERFRSRTYDRVIIDEASEIPKGNLKFISRSVRRQKDSVLPINLYFISNPSMSSGTEFLKENFVHDSGKDPYFEMTFWDNPYINPYEYAESLQDLDAIDKAFQLEGNWDYTPDIGLLFSKKQYYEQTVPAKGIRNDMIDFGVIGIDLASTGADTTVATYVGHFRDGRCAILDSMEYDKPYPEEPIAQFIEKIAQTSRLDLAIIEKGGGEHADFSERYWEIALREVCYSYNVTLEFRRPVLSKFQRARPGGRAIRTKNMLICKELPTYQRLLNEYMYVHPDKDVMDDFPSPDALDSVSLAYNHINVMKGDGIELSGYTDK